MSTVVTINRYEQDRVIALQALKQSMSLNARQDIDLVDNGIGNLIKAGVQKAGGAVRAVSKKAGTMGREVKAGLKYGAMSPRGRATGAKASRLLKASTKVGQVAGKAKSFINKNPKKVIGAAVGTGAVGMGGGAYAMKKRSG